MPDNTKYSEWGGATAPAFKKEQIMIDFHKIAQCYFMPDIFNASRHDLIIMSRNATAMLKRSV